MTNDAEDPDGCSNDPFGDEDLSDLDLAFYRVDLVLPLPKPPKLKVAKAKTKPIVVPPTPQQIAPMESPDFDRD